MTDKRAARDVLRAVIEALPELREYGVERVRVGADGSVEVDLDTRPAVPPLTVSRPAISFQQAPAPKPRDGGLDDDDPPAALAPHELAVGDSLDVAHLG